MAAPLGFYALPLMAVSQGFYADCVRPWHDPVRLRVVFVRVEFRLNPALSKWAATVSPFAGMIGQYFGVAYIAAATADTAERVTPGLPPIW
jgi:hypothetical protein